jgi:SAM-dependent methyltransferase
MERQRISRLAHADHPIAAPLHDDSVRMLLDRALRRGDERLLDLGCGEGAWLSRALDGWPGVTAVGVDLDPAGLALARERADRAGTGDRLALHHGDAGEFTAPEPFDVVLCVGATHAFGGLLPTLAAARRHLVPGGRVLVGDGFWERPPGPGIEELLGEYDDLAATVDGVTADGWAPVYGYVSTRREWDEYEWSWTGSLTSWALDHPDDPDSAAALEAAVVHRSEWLHGYRGVLGFVTLVLRPDGNPRATHTG